MPNLGWLEMVLKPGHGGRKRKVDGVVLPIREYGPHEEGVKESCVPGDAWTLKASPVNVGDGEDD